MEKQVKPGGLGRLRQGNQMHISGCRKEKEQTDCRWGTRGGRGWGCVCIKALAGVDKIKGVSCVCVRAEPRPGPARTAAQHRRPG